jgi:hypothetical protein
MVSACIAFNASFNFYTSSTWQYQILMFKFYSYDFDNDGQISREDVQMVLYYVPMIKNQNYESNDTLSASVSRKKSDGQRNP